MTEWIRRLSWSSAFIALALAVLTDGSAQAGTTATVVRVTETSDWNRPSPDPSGITYLPGPRKLIVTDGEVDETPQWRGSNVWFTSLAGDPSGSWSTTRWSVEPTGIAVRGRRTLFITDDNRHAVFRVRRGRDDRWGTRDDLVLKIPTGAFGSGDPEGVAVGAGSLFVIDGSDAEVYRLSPGRNGRFDGVPPRGDDAVTSFDTTAIGLGDPEGGFYDPGTGDLFLISRRGQVIVQATQRGEEVATIDISGSGIFRAADIALAPGSDDRTATHVYVVDRGRDNDNDPDENDGRLFEFELSQ